MSSQQVGFSFQSDVIGGASLVHAATGRLLKALSDGGVDFYAVAATVQLGKTIPIQPSQEMAVTALLARRGSRAAFIAKALRIGWGHSDVAIELARTRAGVSALLTIGALASGTTSFTAAQGLSELMVLNGCEPENLPAIDALKSLVAYLAPFLYDSGFSKVFEHIVSSSTRTCNLQGQPIPSGLIATGEAKEWAGAVKHLISTMARDETAYFCINQRAAWLAAYATRILGMAVKITVNTIVAWESAGSQGAAIFQLNVSNSRLMRPVPEEDLQLIKNPFVPKASINEIKFIDFPRTSGGRMPMDIYYPLAKAFDFELGLDTRIERLGASIRQAILRLSMAVLRRLRSNIRGREIHYINGYFSFRQKEIALLTTCQHLGLIEPTILAFQPEAFKPEIMPKRPPEYFGPAEHKGLQWLQNDERRILRQSCDAHTECDNPRAVSGPHCLSQRVGNLIEGFAGAATALMQCVFDPLSLQVCSTALNGETRTGWLDYMNPFTDNHESYSQRILTHLSHLVHGQDAINAVDNTTLAISAGSTSIYYRIIMDEECFDSAGRTIAITSGRISVHKVLRSLVKSGTESDNSVLSAGLPDGSSNLYLPGLEIKPHYAKGAVRVSMDCELSENSIILSCYVESERRRLLAFDISKCIGHLLSCPVAADCYHEHDRPLKVREDLGRVVVSTFLGYPIRDSTKTTQFFALSKCSVEQMLQISAFPVDDVCFQGAACLECAVKTIRDYAGDYKSQYFSSIIMS